MVAALAREVIVLNEKIGEIDRQIEASFRRHKQAAIIASMPGMGDLLGAENLAAIGGGMDLFGSPDRLATYSRPGTGASGLRQGQRQSSPPDITDVCNGLCSWQPRTASPAARIHAGTTTANEPKARGTPKQSWRWPGDESTYCGHFSETSGITNSRPRWQSPSRVSRRSRT